LNLNRALKFKNFNTELKSCLLLFYFVVSCILLMSLAPEEQTKTNMENPQSRGAAGQFFFEAFYERLLTFL